MAGSDDATLIKVAVWGIAMSVFCTAGLTLLYSDSGNSDYSFDEINSYREDLSSFTGRSMLSETPWVLQHVYTPWSVEDGISAEHIDDDNWLYGEELDETQYFVNPNSGAIFRMDKDQMSSSPITVGSDTYSYTVSYRDVSWWDDKSQMISNLLYTLGYNHGERKIVTNTWNYTGARFVCDPTLPFLDESNNTKVSVRDGSLSLVWYSYNSQQGISGGLDIYGGDVLLANYSATDIINAYDSSSGYASTYTFDFDGTKLKLNVRFDQEAIEGGMSLMQAWTEGKWSMAITSISAGLFLDVENSNSYSITMGSMIETFTNIFTFSMPAVSDPLLQVVLWLMVGLPMTIALAIVVMRVANAIKIL